MIETSSPTVWRRWLACEMRRLRQESRLHQSDVANAIGSQVPKVSLIEAGRRNVQTRDLEKLLPLFDVPKDRWDDYFTAIEHAHAKGWWDLYDDDTLPDWLRFFVGLEQGAERLRTYQPVVLPGLLQTPEYASAILNAAWASASQEKIERLVEVRLRRQDALWRDRDPVRMWAIVDEAALRRVVGSREIMRAQLQRVADIAHQNDHINLQVVPFSSAGTYEAAYGAFTVLNFGSSRTDLDVVYLEHRWDAEFLESLSDLDKYSVLFERLGQLAVSPDESIDMLHLIAREIHDNG